MTLDIFLRVFRNRALPTLSTPRYDANIFIHRICDGLMNDYNVEFCHIYAGENFSEEQDKSCMMLKKAIKSFKGKSICACVLIDNYNSNKKVDLENILRHIKACGVYVDAIAFEKDLVPIAGKLMDLIRIHNLNNLKDKQGKIYLENKGNIMIKDKEKFSCAMLIACWMLVRLGIFKIPLIKKTKKNFPGKEIITILPKKYKEVENKALRILENTKYNNIIKKINYLFFD